MNDPLHFPSLTVRVELARGEAGQLARALAALVHRLRMAPPVLATSLLTARPLVGLARSLNQLHRRELDNPPKPGHPTKPRAVRVSYDRLAALLLHQPNLYSLDLEPTERLLLQGIVGKFHQKSLNLSRYLTFS